MPQSPRLEESSVILEGNIQIGVIVPITVGPSAYGRIGFTVVYPELVVVFCLDIDSIVHSQFGHEPIGYQIDIVE